MLISVQSLHITLKTKLPGEADRTSGLTSGEDGNHKERDVGPQVQNGALRSVPKQQVTQTCVMTAF